MTIEGGPYPRIHPREQIVRNAENRLREAISVLVDSEKLTTAEELRVVAGVLGEHIGRIAMYAIRAERHPEDPDKAGGLA